MPNTFAIGLVVAVPQARCPDLLEMVATNCLTEGVIGLGLGPADAPASGALIGSLIIDE